MADIWGGLAVIIGILFLPILIVVAYYFIDSESFRKFGVWIWLAAGIAEILLLFLMIPLVI